ncbi:MAG TPA: hypothetical protein VD863_20400 [Bradyrhizobium sp.]|nr:hypothetical protein [Bradyrhizobium sp.]
MPSQNYLLRGDVAGGTLDSDPVVAGGCALFARSGGVFGACLLVELPAVAAERSICSLVLEL